MSHASLLPLDVIRVVLEYADYKRAFLINRHVCTVLDVPRGSAISELATS